MGKKIIIIGVYTVNEDAPIKKKEELYQRRLDEKLIEVNCD